MAKDPRKKLGTRELSRKSSNLEGCLGGAGEHKLTSLSKEKKKIYFLRFFN